MYNGNFVIETFAAGNWIDVSTQESFNYAKNLMRHHIKCKAIEIRNKIKPPKVKKIHTF